MPSRYPRSAPGTRALLHVVNERALPLQIALTVASDFSGVAALEIAVALRLVRVRAQEVPKDEMALPQVASEEDRMDVVAARTSFVEEQSAGNAVLAEVLVAERFHRRDGARRQLECSHAD